MSALRFPLAVAAAVMLAAVEGMGAQQVRGTVRDSTTGVPVAGAVITTMDSLDRVGRRSVTDERGSYFVTATGARRLRIVRLGFRPVDVDLAQRDLAPTIDVIMARIPYQLQQVRVVAGAKCPRRSDRTAALALLEQARAGLLATVVARSDKPARMTRLSIERWLDTENDRIMRQRVKIDSAPSTRAYGAARSAGAFVEQGFASDSAEDRTFYAPDADVLLDDGFASGYCFHIMPPVRSRPNQVGLGFKVADRNPRRVDVDGALWIDTVARALVDIRFRYVGLDRRLDEFEPGGFVGFRELANGVVLIDRWHLRIVGGEPDTVNGGRRPITEIGARGDPIRSRPLRFVLTEVGGELSRASWADGYTWTASLGTLRLRLTTDQGTPAAGTTIRLDDTDYSATSDSTGFVEIRDLAPGPYTASIVDPRLQSIGVELATRLTFSAARDSIVQRTLVAKTAEQYVRDRCNDNRPINLRPGVTATSDTALLIGRVSGPDGPLDKVHVKIVDGADAETGTDGIFVYCRGTIGDRLTIDFQRRGMQGGDLSVDLNRPLVVVPARMEPDKR